jgi:hypothetical protein
MTATDLATMSGSPRPAVSPDGRWLVYQLRETDLAANRGRTDLVAARPQPRQCAGGEDRLDAAAQ